MRADYLYECKDNIEKVPHLLIDTEWVLNKDEIIIINICSKYKVHTLENAILSDNLEFWYSLFEKDDVVKSSFARELRHLIWSGYDETCKFIIQHSAVKTVDIDVGIRDSFFAAKIMKKLYDESFESNFYLQKITFYQKGKRIIPWNQEEFELDKIMQRNRSIFLRKYEVTLILLGISRFRKISTAICKDVMKLIAQMVFSTDPSIIFKIMNSEN